jgi:hypothetical protein
VNSHANTTFQSGCWTASYTLLLNQIHRLNEESTDQLLFKRTSLFAAVQLKLLKRHPTIYFQSFCGMMISTTLSGQVHGLNDASKVQLLFKRATLATLDQL